MLGSLGWPILLGAAATSLFYVSIYRGPLNLPVIHRYFASHPVTFAEVGMFFVGVAALVLKLAEVSIQFWASRLVQLEAAPAGGEPVEAAAERLEQLALLPAAARNSYLGRRLIDALHYVQRQGDASQLNDELKYLADMDAGRQQESFALVRIIIWATPMLGFLGTVMGITQALGDLDPQQLATDIQTAMEGLLSGLYVAFDTTALALTLSIVLMFAMFLLDRMETQILAAADLQAAETLTGRFQQIGTGTDPHLTSMGLMCQQVIASAETLVQRQTELWQTAIDTAQQRWSQLVQGSGSQVQASLQQALDQSLAGFAERMSQLDRESAGRVQRRWEQLQAALAENARAMHTQQRELIRQGEVMAEVVQATGNVMTLEKTLNDNLHALAGSKNFEDTVMSLSAAIHLLSARLGTPAAKSHTVDLKHPASKERAA